MTDGRGFPELRVPAVSRQPALVLRPWRAADIPPLAAEMSREYPVGGMWPGPGERPGRTALPGGTQRRAGPVGERAAARWLASQDRGWRDGDRLSFAILSMDDAGGCALTGNVGLKNREEAGQVGERKTAEIGYWTAVAARGRGIAPAAVRAVTDWVFDAFAGAGLRQIMLVHDVGNPASCRVAHKAGYPFRELSPANPPRWLTDGHIHMRLGGWPGPTADAQQGTTLSIRPGTTSRSAVSPVTCLQRRSRLVTAELKSGARYRRISARGLSGGSVKGASVSPVSVRGLGPARKLP
jgi:RimJ/RimL family protein N-acetyltransferase